MSTRIQGQIARSNEDALAAFVQEGRDRHDAYSVAGAEHTAYLAAPNACISCAIKVELDLLETLI
jgi:hypothetical protein